MSLPPIPKRSAEEETDSDLEDRNEPIPGRDVPLFREDEEAPPPPWKTGETDSEDDGARSASGSGSSPASSSGSETDSESGDEATPARGVDLANPYQQTASRVPSRLAPANTASTAAAVDDLDAVLAVFASLTSIAPIDLVERLLRALDATRVGAAPLAPADARRALESGAVRALWRIISSTAAAVSTNEDFAARLPLARAALDALALLAAIRPQADATNTPTLAAATTLIESVVSSADDGVDAALTSLLALLRASTLVSGAGGGSSNVGASSAPRVESSRFSSCLLLLGNIAVCSLKLRSRCVVRGAPEALLSIWQRVLASTDGGRDASAAVASLVPSPRDRAVLAWCAWTLLRAEPALPLQRVLPLAPLLSALTVLASHDARAATASADDEGGAVALIFSLRAWEAMWNEQSRPRALLDSAAWSTVCEVLATDGGAVGNGAAASTVRHHALRLIGNVASSEEEEDVAAVVPALPAITAILRRSEAVSNTNGGNARSEATSASSLSSSSSSSSSSLCEEAHWVLGNVLASGSALGREVLRCDGLLDALLATRAPPDGVLREALHTLAALIEHAPRDELRIALAAKVDAVAAMVKSACTTTTSKRTVLAALGTIAYVCRVDESGGGVVGGAAVATGPSTTPSAAAATTTAAAATRVRQEHEVTSRDVDNHRPLFAALQRNGVVMLVCELEREHPNALVNSRARRLLNWLGVRRAPEVEL